MSNGIVVLSHAKCKDGLCSEAVVRKRFGDRVEKTFFLENGKQESADMVWEGIGRFVGKDVIIVDLSLISKEFLPLMDKIEEVSSSVTLIDHHRTSLIHYAADKDSVLLDKTENMVEGRKGKVSFTIDVDESGASLAWKTLFPGKKIPRFVELVREGDIYRFTSIESRAFAIAASKLEFDVEKWISYVEDDASVEKIIASGMNETVEYERKCTEIVSSAKPAFLISPDGKEHECMFVECERAFRNRVGEMLCENGAGFAAILTERGDSIQVSLRSSADGSGTNVREVAEAFGRGGHDSAAAIAIPKDGFDSSLRFVERTKKPRV